MAFAWLKRNRKAATARPPGRATPGDRPPAAAAVAADGASPTGWSLRFEDRVRLALTDLADSLQPLRRARATHAGAHVAALAIAGVRDALEEVARSGEDPALLRASRLFSEILARPGTALATRVATAQLALDTLTFLTVAGASERRARALVALAQLERAARRARAA